MRMIAGISSTNAAERVGVTCPTWSNWESGKRGVTTDNLAKIVAMFGIDDERAIRADTLDYITAEHELVRTGRNSVAAEVTA